MKKDRYIIPVLYFFTFIIYVFGFDSIDSFAAQSQNQSEQPDKVVIVKFDGKFSEVPPGVNLGFSDLKFNLIWNKFKLLRQLANDSSVKAVAVVIDKPELNLAQCQQLAMELERIKEKGKKVYVHSDSITSSVYQIALKGDVIAMSPGSFLELTGIRATVFYYAGLMKKLGIEADVEAIGNYKLLGEPFTSTQPSKYMKVQLNSLIDDLYNQLINSISKSRKLDIERVKTIIDNGPFVAEQAKKEKLIDYVMHRKEFLKLIKQKEHARIVFNYDKPVLPKIREGFGGLIQLFSMIGSKATKKSGNLIAIIYINGFITEGSSTEYFGSAESCGSKTLRKAFDYAYKNSQIKAVVLRINSPGGSSAASEIIAQQVYRLRKHKPVIVSMGKEAASGGYYIASAADFILAAPATITGSIGVVSGKPVLKGLLSKLDINSYTVCRGKNASMLDITEHLTAAQRKEMRAQMMMIFNQFKERVKQGRKGKIKDIDKVANGKVFTGQQAVKLGLADKIGTLADAVILAAKMAKIKSYSVVNLPKPKSLAEVFLERLGYQTDTMQIRHKFLMNLLNIDSAMIDFDMLYRVMGIIELMRKENVLAIMPYYIELR